MKGFTNCFSKIVLPGIVLLLSGIVVYFVFFYEQDAYEKYVPERENVTKSAPKSELELLMAADVPENTDADKKAEPVGNCLKDGNAAREEKAVSVIKGERAEINEKTAVQLDYENALANFENGLYEKAAELYERCARAGMTECLEKAEEARNHAAYAEASELYGAEAYAEALVLYDKLGSFKDSEEMSRVCGLQIKYHEAYEEWLAGNTEKAAELYDSLEDFRYSRADAYLIREGIGKPGIDCVYFGSYEQDGDRSNGKETLEWLPLGFDEQGLILLTRYCPAVGMFQKVKPYEVTWETCSMREWLNSTFLQSAFNSDERGKLVLSKCVTEKNPVYGIPGGEDTEDYVFCLSAAEVEKYGVGASKGTAAAGPGYYYWLRSPGHNYGYFNGMDEDGVIDIVGCQAHYDNHIRPAVRV